MHNHSGEIKIRLFAQDDLNAVLKIHKACKGVGVWGARDYEQLAADPRGAILVAEQDGQMLPNILGFLAFYRLEGEAEIWNLAIAPAYRRRGIARELLKEACRLLSLVRVNRLFLEVRESNFPALELYRSLVLCCRPAGKTIIRVPKKTPWFLFITLLNRGIERSL